MFAKQFFLACDNGTFGKDCKNVCGECLVHDNCFHANGTCLNGCAPGYQGFLCKTRMYKKYKIKYLLLNQYFSYNLVLSLLVEYFQVIMHYLYFAVCHRCTAFVFNSKHQGFFFIHLTVLFRTEAKYIDFINQRQI